MPARLNRLLYLLMELSEREFDSKLLLALSAVERGFDVVLGQQWLIVDHFDTLPPGIVLLKGINRIERNRMVLARRGGHKVVALEEESLGIASRSHMTFGVPIDMLEGIDLVISQGSSYTDALTTLCPDVAGKIVTCGNPRVDMLRPELRAMYAKTVDDIRRRFGRFTLINTNFSWPNSIHGPPKALLAIQINTGYYDPLNPADARRVRARVAADQIEYDAYRRLLRELAHAHPDRRFILRPHLGEVMETWSELAADLANVTVIREGSANYWGLAADIVVHRSCTTGFEAHLLGRRTVSYCAFPHFHYDELIFNQMLPMETSHDRVMEIVGDLDTHGPRLDGHRQRTYGDLASHVAALDGPLAATRIADALADLAVASDAGPLSGPIAATGLVVDRERSRAERTKFSVSLDMVVDRVADLRRALPSLPAVRVVELADSLFQLFPARA